MRWDRSTRTLVDVAAILAVAWLWIAVYESFTRSGLWLVISRAVGGATTLPSEAAVLAACVLLGWLALASSCWLAWRLFLRSKRGRDLPEARLRR